MKNRLLFLPLSFFLLTIFFSAEIAFSQELRIIDNIGLTRAVKHVQGPSRVVLDIRSEEQELALKLIHSEGFFPELPASRDNSSYVFSEVPAGTWRISTPAEHTVIRVRIE
jgi:hypothetical protein